MNELNALRAKLQPHLGWHGARTWFVAAFLIALFKAKTVNLSELATAFPGLAKPESHYKRQQRFFRAFELDYAVIARLVVAWIDIPEPWVLAVDRTQWDVGTTPVNILTLGVVHEGIAYPLVWVMLDKKGNSNTDERIDLMERFYELFPHVEVRCLTSDREFVGADWLGYLLLAPDAKLATPFRMRIRASEKLYDGHCSLNVRTVFAHLQRGESQVLTKRRRLWGRWVYVCATRMNNNKLLVVATDQAPETAIADYALRWSIETLFGMFKSRGFCLEETSMREAERLKKLFALLTIALCWAVKVGQWLNNVKPLVLKAHGRLSKSVFRYGFDHIRHICSNLSQPQQQQDFQGLLRFLSCT
ncbi:MAG: IS4 family transposase [Cyanobacteria bacterium P01_D01_bin.1]